MRDYRFVPCRRCSEPTPGFWSTEPADIDLVRRVQQRRTPPAPDLGLRERLTAVVHNTLATGGSDTDVADAILAMPEMDAIRLQLGYMANSLAVGCNDDVNHGESMTDTLSEHLDPALITWVLGWHENTADEIERLRPGFDGGVIRVGGRRYQRFNGTWMVHPPMLRGFVPADPVACDWLDEIERLRQMKRAQQMYAVRHHDRDTENDPELATLMRAGEAEGPWHDATTGHPDTIWGMLRAAYPREVGAWHGIGWAYGGDEIEDDSDG
jgi:hypothetical protein